MIKFRKDKTNLLIIFKLYTLDRKHYYHVFIWKDVESLRKNSNDNEEAIAVVNHNPTIIEFSENGSEREIIRPKLGEVHFTIEHFNEEIVAHELLHAILNRIRMLRNPSYSQLEEQEFLKYRNEELMCEEIICLEFGRWFIKTYRIVYDLWKKSRDSR